MAGVNLKNRLLYDTGASQHFVKRQSGFLYLKKLNKLFKFDQAVGKFPRISSAQRWHQRPGHVGQGILKKTGQCSTGLEGIVLSDIATCESCHLSKAQRIISGEPRPTPGEPLDEVFVDTVGKLPTAINAH